MNLKYIESKGRIKIGLYELSNTPVVKIVNNINITEESRKELIKEIINFTEGTANLYFDQYLDLHKSLIK